ncbi:MAG: hypothetical protein ABJE95_10845 [Byssovorax sp.]
MRKLALAASLLTFLDELEYTEAGLAADPDTSELSSAFAEEITAWGAQFTAERASRRAVTRAEAVVAVRDGQIDRLTQRFAGQALAEASGDRKAAAFKRFFPSPASELIRIALRKQCERTRDVVVAELGKVDESSVLRPYLAQFEVVVSSTFAALDVRATARGARGSASHATDEWKEGVNSLRLTTYAELVKIASEKGYPRAWAETFFRVESAVGVPGGAGEETGPKGTEVGPASLRG